MQKYSIDQLILSKGKIIELIVQNNERLSLEKASNTSISISENID